MSRIGEDRMKTVFPFTQPGGQLFVFCLESILRKFASLSSRNEGAHVPRNDSQEVLSPFIRPFQVLWIGGKLPLAMLIEGFGPVSWQTWLGASHRRNEEIVTHVPHKYDATHRGLYDRLGRK